MSRFSEEQLASRAFLRLARILYEQWEEFEGGDTRLFDWLISDKYTYVGRSEKGDEYREHLVPRALIRDICLKQFEAGESIEHVASIIRNLLKVARISRDEAHHIDVQLGLRTSMPPDWDYRSGDYMARLRVGGVRLIEENASGESACSA